MEALDLQQLEWLLYALVAAILVILAALIAYVAITNRRQRDRMRAAYEADRMAPRPAVRISGQLLSLVREEVGGPLQVEIGGDTYARLADIKDPQVRRQVVGSALELIQFTGVLEPTETTSISAPGHQTDTWREDLRESSQAELERIRSQALSDRGDREAAGASEEVEDQFLSLLTEMGRPAPAPEKPSVLGALRRRRLPKLPDDEDPPSFVNDIEQILQRRIQLVPALVGRGLHVRLGDGGTVRFAFQGAEYESLEEIPNLTARQLVQDAIDEWDVRS